MVQFLRVITFASSIDQVFKSSEVFEQPNEAQLCYNYVIKFFDDI